MFFPFSKTPRKRSSFRVLFLSMLVALAMLVAACGSDAGNTGSGNTTTTPPADANPLGLITPGVLLVGSDTTYPPQEFIDASGQPVGFDVDLIKAIGAKLNLKVEVKTANFTTIIDDTIANRYDIAISAITINEERQKKVDFVPYFQAGKSLLVHKGNPEKIQAVKDLCGKAVGVQEGTVEHEDLMAANTDGVCKDNNANLTILKDQTAVIQLLVDKRVVATYQDSPVTDYYNSQNPGLFEIGGQVVDTAPQGIAVSKTDTALFQAIEKAFNELKADGTYDKLFEQWKLEAAQKISLTEFRPVYA